MKTTSVDSLVKYLIGSKLIGVGTTAACFRMRDGRVIKVYLNTHRKRELFYRKDMYEHLEFLSELNNDNYIGPREVLVHGNDILAYIMDYVPGKTINKITSSSTINEIIEAVKKLEESTFKISELYFRLGDLHGKNIIYNGDFLVIDLDDGILSESFSKNNLMEYNMQDLLNQIIYAIFEVKITKDLYFRAKELEDLYKKVLYKDYCAYVELLLNLGNVTREVNPSIADLRKNKCRLIITEDHVDYYGRNLY